MDPWLYYAHHHHYQDDFPFWLEIVRRSGSPVLELGCGTGRVTIPIAQAGFQIYGLDDDLGMLQVLQQLIHASTIIQSPLLVQGDMRNLPTASLFNTIILPCNTLSTFTIDDQQHVIAQAFQHLKPAGIFAASFPKLEAFLELPDRSESEIEEVFHHPQSQDPVQVSSEWERNNNIFTFQWHYDHLLPDGNVNRTSIQVEHHLYPAESYRHLFNEIGYSSLKMYGDFDFSPLTFDSPYLILVARK